MQTEQQHPRSARTARRILPAGGILAVAIGLAACTGGATVPSSVPTIDVPTALPTLGMEGSGGPEGSAAAACVDAQTMAVLDQLKAPGANVATILSQNKDQLIAGLGTFDPPDAATTAWRDALVQAISSGDTAAITAQLAVLANGGVTITAC